MILSSNNLLGEEARGMLERLLQQVQGVSSSTFFSSVQYAVDQLLGMIYSTLIFLVMRPGACWITKSQLIFSLSLFSDEPVCYQNDCDGYECDANLKLCNKST